MDWKPFAERLYALKKEVPAEPALSEEHDQPFRRIAAEDVPRLLVERAEYETLLIACRGVRGALAARERVILDELREMWAEKYPLPEAAEHDVNRERFKNALLGELRVISPQPFRLAGTDENFALMEQQIADGVADVHEKWAQGEFHYLFQNGPRYNPHKNGQRRLT